MRVFLPVVCLLLTLTAGCSEKDNAPVAAADRNEPGFDPMAFFAGHTRSWGVIENRSGAPTERIVTNGVGVLDGNDQLRVVQHLSFQDGTIQERDWVLWRSGPGRFDATANDMVGTAEGSVDGRTFYWQWVLARSPGHPLMNVTMRQWMYRMDDGSVTVRTTVSKFGIIVAEVTEQFTRPAGPVTPS